MAMVLRLLWLIALLLATGPLATATDGPRICSSIDIRNSPTYFTKLEGCQVIEGSLQILLIENATDTDYATYSFPALREITDYLLLFRVSGLKSLVKMFPNLSVIRGKRLFGNYALVVFEMPDLQNLGFSNLTVIERGGVRITDNPQLCFTKTIDWSRITQNTTENLIKNNHLNISPKCHDCPEKVGGTSCSKQAESAIGVPGRFAAKYLCWDNTACQRICSTSCTNEGRSCHFNSTSTCCDPQCLGGCFGAGNDQCFACKNMANERNGVIECVQNCKHAKDQPKFAFMDRRCVTFEECQRMAETRNEPGKQYKIFLAHGGTGGPPDSCVAECPAGYEESRTGDSRCVKCQGICPKTCPGGKITNVAEAQKFKGCTIIAGALEISLRTHVSNIAEELMASLKDVQEIHNYLKVVRSNSLITLHFFKDLRVIHGKNLDRQDYALLVFDNMNLQELFPNTTTTSQTPFEIKNGKLFFHMNPKLCLKKIKEFRREARITTLGNGDLETHDVSSTSNGDRMACETKDLNLTITKLWSKQVLVTWNNFKLPDFRQLLGYYIYYREASGNVTMFDGVDTCGSTTWFIQDREMGSDHRDQSDSMTELIGPLKPFTRYAIYIKTYTVATEQSGGVTDIQYFTTLPATSEPPTSPSARSDDPNSLQIEWKLPRKPNGIISYYIIEITPKDQETDNNDYCADPLKYTERTTKIEPNEDVNTKPNITHSQFPLIMQNGTNEYLDPKTGRRLCDCAQACQKLSQNMEQEVVIAFEDYLLNLIYVKNPSAASAIDNTSTTTTIATVEHNKVLRRRRRFADQQNGPNEMADTVTDDPPTVTTGSNDTDLFNLTTSDMANMTAGNETEPEKVKPLIFRIDANKTQADGSLSLEVKDLDHYQLYNIEILACHAEPENEIPIAMGDNPYNQCSMPAIHITQTAKLPSANDLPLLTAAVKTIQSHNITSKWSLVELRWDDPYTPNGQIVFYQIEYRRTDIGKAEPIHKCLTPTLYRQKRGYDLEDLPAGDYHAKVRVSSVGDLGRYSKEVRFYVPDAKASSSAFIIAGIVIFLFLALGVMVVISFYHYRKLKLERDNIHMQYVTINPDYMSAYNPDDWEVDRKLVTFGRLLGKGSFGEVFEGIVRNLRGDGAEIKCAIKTVSETSSASERYDFLKEASVMKAFECSHVVKLLGVVSIGQPACVLMELMALGDLKTFLRNRRPCEENPDVVPPTLGQLYKMAAEIADGMAYLAAKKYVHRDLAGRNCMVSGDWTVKIGDFGMTRDIYDTDYYRKENKGLLPVRWMAPESLRDGIFTSYSDVWSFGVVLWEMVTLAMQPYQGLSNEQVLKYVLSGCIMEKPENCPEKTFTIMTMCWARNPKARPTFIEIIEILLPDVESSNFADISWYHNHWLTQPQPIAESYDDESSPLTAGIAAGSGIAADLLDDDDLDQSGPTVALLDDQQHRRPSLQEAKFFPTSVMFKVPEENDQRAATQEDLDHEIKYLQIEINNSGAPGSGDSSSSTIAPTGAGGTVNNNRHQSHLQQQQNPHPHADSFSSGTGSTLTNSGVGALGSSDLTNLLNSSVSTTSTTLTAGSGPDGGPLSTGEGLFTMSSLLSPTLPQPLVQPQLKPNGGTMTNQLSPPSSTNYATVSAMPSSVAASPSGPTSTTGGAGGRSNKTKSNKKQKKEAKNNKNKQSSSAAQNSDNSKSSTIQSSDGSKDSKISNNSNGSVCNGHLTKQCTSEC